MAKNRKINNPDGLDVEITPGDNKAAKFKKDGGMLLGSDIDDSKNPKLHKSGDKELQVVSGDDATSEGAQSSDKTVKFRSGTIATSEDGFDIGTEGRITYNESTKQVEVTHNNSSSSQALGLSIVFGAVVGTAADVTNGDAQYSTIASAVAAVSAGDKITLLPRTFTENLVLTKEVHVFGSGKKSIINGTVQFSTGSDASSFEKVKFNDDVTVDNTVTKLILTNSWLNVAKTVTDNNASDADSLYELVED